MCVCVWASSRASTRLQCVEHKFSRATLDKHASELHDRKSRTYIKISLNAYLFSFFFGRRRCRAIALPIDDDKATKRRREPKNLYTKNKIYATREGATHTKPCSYVHQSQAERRRTSYRSHRHNCAVVGEMPSPTADAIAPPMGQNAKKKKQLRATAIFFFFLFYLSANNFHVEAGTAVWFQCTRMQTVWVRVHFSCAVPYGDWLNGPGPSTTISMNKYVFICTFYARANSFFCLFLTFSFFFRLRDHCFRL